MGSATGFKFIKRKAEGYKSISERIENYNEVTINSHNIEQLRTQGARCMDCGVPFCQSDMGCPINNLIPEWNDLVFKNRWEDALSSLLKTNNFPEFTGRVCPAPCEGSCVLGINNPAVTIKNIEQTIIDEGFNNNLTKPRYVANRTQFKIAIVGSGPAGLTVADELNQMGHNAVVFERDDRIGGLLMYGIPNMKLEKNIVNRRINLLKDEGIEFITNVEIGKDISLAELEKTFDATVLTTGATVPQDLPIAGRTGDEIYFAMEYLKESTKSLLNKTTTNITAQDKNVIVIGGGDTGTDCIATALRQGAKSIVNFELMEKPPIERDENNPWPQWPLIYRVDYGHAEAKFKYGNDPRSYNLITKEFINKNGKLVGIKTVNVSFENGKLTEIAGTERIWSADMALLSIGFVSPESIEDIITDDKGNYKAEYGDFKTNKAKIFTAGDCRRGQSLVVWAINEGRLVSQKINKFLQQ